MSTGRRYLRNYEPLTDDILESLIGQKVDITSGGSSMAGLILEDVSSRAIWVRWPSKEERFDIKLEDIVTLSYSEVVHHQYRNPNIPFDDPSSSA